MLLEIVVPEGVTLPRPLEVLAARVICQDENGFKAITKDRYPGKDATVTVQLNRRLDFNEWIALAAVFKASIAQADKAIARMPAPPEANP